MKKQLLTNKNIQEFIDELENTINKFNIQKHNKTWLRLFIEETLLKYHDVFGDKTTWSYQRSAWNRYGCKCLSFISRYCSGRHHKMLLCYKQC